MSILKRLSQWVEAKPLILLRFPDRFEEDLLDSKRGTERFTIAKPHNEFDGLKLPTLCLAEMPNGNVRNHYIGVVAARVPVTTFDSRLTVVTLRSLNLPSLNSLADQLVGRGFRTALKSKVAANRFAQLLSPKLSVAIIEALSADPENRKAIEVVATKLPRLRKVSAAQFQQFDAVKVALRSFGVSPNDFPERIDVPEGSDSTLSNLASRAAHALEDNAIAKDASVVPGFTLIEKHVTGLAVFMRGEECLHIYTANRGPLEAMLGVDLIYLNETLGNMVSLQYKMLEAQGTGKTTDWIFRPDDQLRDEIERMRLPAIAGQLDDYQLNRNPFFFKFIRREGDGETHQSFIVSLDHLNQLLASINSEGPKGGVRVSYEALDGAYLREGDIIGLIRSGYVGTHRVESDALKQIFAEVVKGNRTLVLAWQTRIKRDSTS